MLELLSLQHQHREIFRPQPHPLAKQTPPIYNIVPSYYSTHSREAPPMLSLSNLRLCEVLLCSVGSQRHSDPNSLRNRCSSTLAHSSVGDLRSKVAGLKQHRNFLKTKAGLWLPTLTAFLATAVSAGWRAGRVQTQTSSRWQCS
ncbi:hypothetical protein AOLI_G00004800 [Acnodon oligacanthus]